MITQPAHCLTAHLLALLALSDIRQHTQAIREALVRSRAGDYPDRTGT